MEKRTVYADNAATTRVYPEVAQAMLPYLTEIYGNPSSLHTVGQMAKEALNASRQTIADVFGCNANEIYFTASGSEADNWAIKGIVGAACAKGKKHIITSKIEHHAVLHTCEALAKSGCEITYLDVDKYGFVDPADVEKAIRPDTALVSVMYANNEVGTIEPVEEIAAVSHAKGVPFFTDAVQAAGTQPIDVKKIGCDMLSASGHKIHAPKGIGVLYVKNGTRLRNLVDGGGQERGKRSGTENVAEAVALAKAFEIAKEQMKDNASLIAKRDRLIKEILTIPYSRLTGHPTNRLPGNASFVFEFIEGESLLLLLDMAGICVSTGSACSSNSLEPSHVLLSLGIPHEIAHGSLRLSISHDTTDEDIDYISENVKRVVDRLRQMSPIYPGNK